MKDYTVMPQNLRYSEVYDKWWQTITVHEGHIARGGVGCARTCMMYLALTGSGLDIEGVAEGYAVTRDGREVAFPKSITERIKQFDRHKKVSPFYFQITRRGNNLLAVGEATDVGVHEMHIETTGPAHRQLPVQALSTKAKNALPVPSYIEVSEDGIHWFTIEQHVTAER